jgi:hypothetical protein
MTDEKKPGADGPTPDFFQSGRMQAPDLIPATTNLTDRSIVPSNDGHAASPEITITAFKPGRSLAIPISVMPITGVEFNAGTSPTDVEVLSDRRSGYGEARRSNQSNSKHAHQRLLG